MAAVLLSKQMLMGGVPERAGTEWVAERIAGPSPLFQSKQQQWASPAWSQGWWVGAVLEPVQSYPCHDVLGLGYATWANPLHPQSSRLPRPGPEWRLT